MSIIRVRSTAAVSSSFGVVANVSPSTFTAGGGGVDVAVGTEWQLVEDPWEAGVAPDFTALDADEIDARCFEEWVQRRPLVG